MCVIIYAPKGKNITNDTLRKCFKANGDSIGYMFSDKGKINIQKFLNYKNFLKSFRKDFKEFGDGSDFIVHFRIATSGKIDLENCHPFQIDDNHAFVHNGVITGWGNNSCSDTNEFRTKILTPLAQLSPDFMDSPAVEELIRGYVGSFNKMVFLRSDGEAWILNDKQGTWKAGVWFSNTYWDHDIRDYVWQGRNYGGYEGSEEWEGYGHGVVSKNHTSTAQNHPACSSEKPVSVPALLAELPKVACSSCGTMTIQQDRICNTCWSKKQEATKAKV